MTRVSGDSFNGKKTSWLTPVGAAEGCDLLIQMFKSKDQKIAASFHSSAPTGRIVAGYFCVPSSCCRFAWVRFAPAGTLRVSHTLPPMVEPFPMVIRPRIVAPA